jgi:membrane protease YdiL (CAAX protease family)
LLLSGLTILVTRHVELQPVEIKRPMQEALVSLGWLGGVFVLDVVTRAQGIELVNQFTNWLFLAGVPFILLLAVQRQGLRRVLRSVGLTRLGIGGGLRAGGVVALGSIPILYIVGEQQRAGIEMLINEGIAALALFAAAFLFALSTAAFVEEVFFRGILQSRLSAWLHSEWRGLLLASLLFGLLHLPLYFFSSFEPTHGNLIWSLTAVISEQGVFGVLLGMLWARTRNLAAPILVHAFVLALAFMTNLQIGVS